MEETYHRLYGLKALMLRYANVIGPRVKHMPPPPERSETFFPGFCLSVEKIRKKLGFKSTWTIEAGVDQLITYYRDGEALKRLGSWGRREAACRTSVSSS